MNPGVYIHIPFCEQRCYYCAFTVAVTSESAFEPYVGRLIREIELVEPPRRPETIYFGGGTPSVLPAYLLERIMGQFDGCTSEVSIEVNPGTLSRDRLESYRSTGINRISLGAQSLEDEDLRRAGRLHKASEVVSDFEMLRRAGFANINIDLIAGLPEQQLRTWCDNLEKTIRLAPEHISVYMLDVEEHSRWGQHSPALLSNDDYAEFYAEAEARLAAAGYVHYEISNWALPGAECKHNLGYWNARPYIGLGVGAHSCDGRRRFWNTSSLAEYAKRLDSGALPVSGEEILTHEMKVEEAFLLGLRQTAGLNVRIAAVNLGLRYPDAWYERVQQLREAGLIEFDGTILKLTPMGRLVANAVIEELIWPSHISISEATL